MTSRTRAPARSTSWARSCRSMGMGGVVLGILVWQEGGEFVVLLMVVGAVAWWCWPGG